MGIVIASELSKLSGRERKGTKVKKASAVQPNYLRCPGINTFGPLHLTSLYTLHTVTA